MRNRNFLKPFSRKQKSPSETMPYRWDTMISTNPNFLDPLKYLLKHSRKFYFKYITINPIKGGINLNSAQNAQHATC